MHLKNGAVLEGGKYRIEKLLGQGGFGITYLALQSGLNRKVAIKEFFMKDFCNRDADTSHVSVPSVGSRELVERFMAKFLKEAATIAAMENERIVRIYDIFEENGTAYYVMEYLGEDNLQSRIPASGMPYQEAVGYIRQIAAALGYIHSQNILHLDVKPSNVLFRKGTDAVLIDFGVSKHYDGEGGSQTSSTPVGLSRGYAPLEQNKAGGVSQFTPSTDIYALGATFYKLVTGQTPPEADEVNEDGLPAFQSEVPFEIASVIDKSMQPRRKDRPQHINEFLAILDSALKNIVPTHNSDPDPVVIQPEDIDPEPVVDPSGDKTTLEDDAGHDTGKLSAPRNHAWVDLGLSVKWATCNVGASSPEDSGKHYVWGEIVSEEEGNVSDGRLYRKSTADISGNSTYDAARTNWGGDWRLPTKAEFEELLNNCVWEWTTQNGHNGCRVTSKKNGQSIFLPAAGWRYGADEYNVGSYGDYWSSTPYESNTGNAYGLFFGKDSHYVGRYRRSLGRSVRPVLE